jgi:catechol 2,3-dioxygenase-like lactoylglutathione lyase family enzyme
MTLFDRRTFLAALPALAYAPRLVAEAPVAPFRVAGLSQLTLTVSDIQRSLDFYQGLFGMPIQARQGGTILLRIGSGPKFLELRPAAAGQRPSISAFGMAIERFDVDRALKTLGEHGVTPANASADNPGSKQSLVRVRKANPGRSANSTRDLFVGDPSGVVFQMHDVSYCGGSGTQGDVCRMVEPSKKKGSIAVTDMSHFTIAANDPETVPFYQELFGFQPQVYQAATPAWGVGAGVHFLMFTGNAGGPTRARAPAGAGRGADRGSGLARAGIDHACMAMNDFDPDRVTQLLVEYGIKKAENQTREPLMTYISLRMPNRGGAESGTPELYFTDPDGLAIQLQDVKYCGGGGFLGEVCPQL